MNQPPAPLPDSAASTPRSVGGADDDDGGDGGDSTTTSKKKKKRRKAKKKLGKKGSWSIFHSL